MTGKANKIILLKIICKNTAIRKDIVVNDPNKTLNIFFLDMGNYVCNLSSVLLNASF
jgi:hypothetical protein